MIEFTFVPPHVGFRSVVLLHHRHGVALFAHDHTGQTHLRHTFPDATHALLYCEDRLAVPLEVWLALPPVLQPLPQKDARLLAWMDMLGDVLRYLYTGSKIHAIKRHRTYEFVGLRESKEAVEAIQHTFRTGLPLWYVDVLLRAAVERSLRAGAYARAESYYQQLTTLRGDALRARVQAIHEQMEP
ncbi:MAG: hypothetical protein AAGK74_06005 [Chloroflexota bacterium]